MAVTAVSTGFEWRESAAGRILVSTALDRIASHLFSSREWAGRGAVPDYAAVAAALGRQTDDVAWARQVHGASVLIVRLGEALTDPRDADAVVSVDPARVVLVRVADCVPVLLADRRGRTVAAVHAGWRGTAAGVIRATVRALSDLSTPGADLVAAIGPSIGPCCYQVDAVVRDTFLKSAPMAERWFTPDGPDRWKLDLWTAARDQLVDAGVPVLSIAVARSCTAHNPDDWWSHRRDGAAAGRMVAGIGLR